VKADRTVWHRIAEAVRLDLHALRAYGSALALVSVLVGCGEATAPQSEFVVEGVVVAPGAPVEGARVVFSFSGACTIGGCFEEDRQFSVPSGPAGDFLIRATLEAGTGCRGSWYLEVSHADYYADDEYGTLLRADAGAGCSPFEMDGLTLAMEPYLPLAVLTTSLPAATVGVHYSVFLQATRTRDIVVWSLPEGSLPPGLTLSAAGEIAGTPSTGGTWTFTVEARTGTWGPDGELLEDGLEVAQAELSLQVTGG
jgi:hypothetical protein